MTSTSERILDVHGELTRSERRLADLLLGDPDALLLHSAAELAQRAGVSKATTTRFFRRLGYASSKTAQREAREGAGEGGSAVRPDRMALGKATLSKHLSAEMQNLVRSVEGLRPDELARAVGMMAHAEKLWVVGFGDNYPLAHLARALLIRVKPDIRMIPIGGFPVPEEFASIRSTDTLLALGVGRRTRSLGSILLSAREAETSVVLVTDQAALGASDRADVTLRCRTHGVGVFESAVAPVSLLTYLCSSLALRLGEGALDRLRSIDRIHREWGDLIDDA